MTDETGPDLPPQDDAPAYDAVAAHLADLRAAIAAHDVDTIHHLMSELHAADKAELLEGISEDERAVLVAMLSEQFDGEILSELDPDIAEEVMEALGPDKSAEALSQLETNDAVQIIEELSEEGQQSLLDAVPELLREELEESLSYPEDAAGRLMTKKCVAVPQFWTVGDAIDYLRSTDDLPDNFYAVHVVDAKHHPTHRVLLGQMMKHKRTERIVDIAEDETYSVTTHTDQEEVAFLFTKYGLVEAPVVNATGRLVGIITVDDVVHVIHEEEEEDYLRAGGVSAQDIQAGLLETVRMRFSWLFINLLTAVLASVVIGLYAHTIQKLVALAVLMPIVASMGGNAGIQSVTVAVRALATRQLRGSNAVATIRKEFLIGLLNGLLLAAIMGGGAWLWYDDANLALVFGAATIIALTLAGFSGALIPIVLARLKIDPAPSSGIFLTTITDVVGFLSFLGLAAWWIG